MSEQQPWEPGVIARYLTIAGATVDIHANPDGATHPVTCLACPWETRAYGPIADGLTPEYKAKAALDDAHSRAQAHAERCRALPRPAVTQ